MLYLSDQPRDPEDIRASEARSGQFYREVLYLSDQPRDPDDNRASEARSGQFYKEVL